MSNSKKPFEFKLDKKVRDDFARVMEKRYLETSSMESSQSEFSAHFARRPKTFARFDLVVHLPLTVQIEAARPLQKRHRQAKRR